MATKVDTQFGVTISNVPTINIRLEFNTLLGLFRNSLFRSQFLGDKGKAIPIYTPDFTWRSRAHPLLTHLVREAIVGLESAVSGAVFTESMRNGTMTLEILEATNNPFSLKGLGTADRVFNRLPSLLDSSFALSQRKPSLWERVQGFYSELRNPLFHAYEISETDPEPVWRILEFIWEIYSWLNEWHLIERLLEGPVHWNPATQRMVTEIPHYTDEHVSRVVLARTLPRAVAIPRGEWLCLEDIRGMTLPGGEEVVLTGKKPNGELANVSMSPFAAMKMLGFLALAHERRGWEIPDRLW